MDNPLHSPTCILPAVRAVQGDCETVSAHFQALQGCIMHHREATVTVKPLQGSQQTITYDMLHATHTNMFIMGYWWELICQLTLFNQSSI